MARTRSAQAEHAEPNYLGIVIVLGILTAAEIGVTFLQIPRFLTGAMLVILALSKAFLVALYFMHLRFEKKALTLIALTPLVLCALLMFALLPDSNPDENLQVRSESSTAAPLPS
ncbi:MAG: cytochrome C oxidase subunit IV family protein [Acidobacteriota bacterium]